MSFYPHPSSQTHSVYSPLPSVTAYPASSHSSRRSRRHSTSSFPSYPPVLPGNANYGLNSYPQIPHWYGQGYPGVPTRTSAFHNGQVPYPIPQQPQPVHQTQRFPYFGNPYIPGPPGNTVIQAPGRTMGQGITPHYNYQGNQSYYPMQGGRDGHPQTIVVKMDGGGRRRRRHHHRRRSSSY